MEARWRNASTIELTGSGVPEWRDGLKQSIPGAEHSYKFKQGYWDGLYYPGRSFRRTPEGGLLFVGAGFAPRLGIPRPDAPPLDLRFPDTLRDYQVSGLRSIIEHKWGRLGFATNAGKGAIIALDRKSVV